MRLRAIYTWPVRNRMSVFRMEDLADRTERPSGVYPFTDLYGMNGSDA